MSYGAKAAERIAGKTVLLTGASSGIGEATALELAAAAKGQLRLILAARRTDRLTALRKKLESQFQGIEVLPATLDVSKYDKIPEFLKSLPSGWTNIDILVNNAGLASGTEKVGTIALADIQSMYFTNVLGLIALTNALLPQFRERNSGDIVNIASIAGREAYPAGSIYCSTKAAVRSFTQSLRTETIDTKVRVIEIDPGAVETEFSVVRYHGDAEQAAKVYEGSEPLTAIDVAELITFAVTRRENTVIADTLIFPSHQAGSAYRHRN